jgi:hypothetical protein
MNLKELFQKENKYVERKIEEILVPYFKKYGYKLIKKEERENVNDDIDYIIDYNFQNNKIAICLWYMIYAIPEDVNMLHYVTIENKRIGRGIFITIKEIDDFWSSKRVNAYLESKTRNFSPYIDDNEGNTFEEKVNNLINNYIRNMEIYLRGVLEGKEWIEGFGVYDDYK